MPLLGVRLAEPARIIEIEKGGPNKEAAPYFRHSISISQKAENDSESI
jgi:hypothetical protein